MRAFYVRYEDTLMKIKLANRKYRCIFYSGILRAPQGYIKYVINNKTLRLQVYANFTYLQFPIPCGTRYCLVRRYDGVRFAIGVVYVINRPVYVINRPVYVNDGIYSHPNYSDCCTYSVFLFFF